MQLTSEQMQFVLTHEHDDLHKTALRFVREDMPLLMTQIAGRQMAKKKLPSWYAVKDIYYPPHVSLEQSSSELTARYKASLITGADSHPLVGSSSLEGYPPKAVKWQNGSLADLTGGMGVDFSFMSPYFRQAAYVEQNDALCKIAEHNFRVLELENVEVHCAAADIFLKDAAGLDVVYIDPSRRDHTGQKVFRIEDCSPVVPDLLSVLFEKSNRVMVKYSPMLDITLALKSLDCTTEVHVVSVDNDCKELLFLLSKSTSVQADNERSLNNSSEGALFVAVNLTHLGKVERFGFTMKQEQCCDIAFCKQPGRFLYEPNASILKAGAFKSIAAKFDIQKLHVNSHLYTSDRLVDDFPGRVFEIESYFAPNKRSLKSFLQSTKKANITVRNFPMTVAEIRRKTGLKEGGEVYLFATTHSDEQKVWIVCRKIQLPS